MLENQIEIIGQREVELLEKNRKVNLQKLFTPEGMSELIGAIKKEVADSETDASTKEGRAKIISIAAKIARCKSPIRELATELKEGSRKFIDGVNFYLKHYETEMDALRDEIRKPVDEIEERKAAQLKARQDRLAEIESYKMRASLPARTSKFLELSIRELKELTKFEWNDFAFKAENLVNEVAEILNQELVSMKKQEADQAELAQLKKEKEEREQKDRDEQIARDAADKVKRDAEDEALRLAKKVEDDKRAAEQAIINAEIRAKEAERLAKESADRAELARVAAEKKAKEDAEKAAVEAVEKERQRVEAQKKADDAAAAKLAENKRHRTKINNEILEAIIPLFPYSEMDRDFAKNNAKTIIEAIAKGEVPHVQINY